MTIHTHPSSPLTVYFSRDPYAHSAIRVQCLSLDTRQADLKSQQIFLDFANQVNRPTSIFRIEESRTFLLKKLLDFHQLDFQIPLAKAIFDSVKNSHSPELYSTFLYLIKKKAHENYFALAHDIFLKAKENNAISSWVLIHYLKIGINCMQFKFLYPIILDLTKTHKEELQYCIVKNFLDASMGIFSEQELLPLKKFNEQKKKIPVFPELCLEKSTLW